MPFWYVEMLLRSQNDEGICKSDHNFVENIYIDRYVYIIFNDRGKTLQLKCVYPMCEYTVSALYILLNA